MKRKYGWENIPLENAVSRAHFLEGLEIEGIGRCYEWAYGVPARLRYEKIRDRILLNVAQRAGLANLLEESQEPYDPNLDFYTPRVSSEREHYGPLGEKPVQLPGILGCYGFSVFQNGDRRILYARFDTGRGCDEREAYDTIVPLTREESRELVGRLREGDSVTIEWIQKQAGLENLKKIV